MKLVAIPLDEHEAWAHHWLPFLPRIAQRSHESVADLIGQIARREVRLVLVMDGEIAQALIGVRVHQMNGKSCGDIIWTAGFGREQWQELLPVLGADAARCRLCHVPADLPARLVASSANSTAIN